MERKQGRRKGLIKKVRVVVFIPEPLLAKVDLILYDPVLQRKPYERSRLINNLLRKWVEEQTGNDESSS